MHVGLFSTLQKDPRPHFSIHQRQAPLVSQVKRIVRSCCFDSAPAGKSGPAGALLLVQLELGIPDREHFHSQVWEVRFEELGHQWKVLCLGCVSAAIVVDHQLVPTSCSSVRHNTELSCRTNRVDR
jgi:hypothetical protein